MESAFWLAILAVVLFALMEQHHWRKLTRIEADLKKYLGDVLVARDASKPPLTVHFQAQVSAVKALIKKHFEL